VLNVARRAGGAKQDPGGLNGPPRSRRRARVSGGCSERRDERFDEGGDVVHQLAQRLRSVGVGAAACGLELRGDERRRGDAQLVVTDRPARAGGEQPDEEVEGLATVGALTGLQRGDGCEELQPCEGGAPSTSTTASTAAIAARTPRREDTGRLAVGIAQRLLAVTLAILLNTLAGRPARALAAYDGR
jgi:hypothetical protein